MSTETEKKKPTAVQIAEDWAVLIRRLDADTLAANNRTGSGKTLTAYEKPDGILQRLTYTFVIKYNKNYTRSSLKEFLDKRLDAADEKADKAAYSGRDHHNAYEFYDNPFDYTLKAVLAEAAVEISDSMRSRTGRALLYAERHDIDPDLLVGFIYQSGKLDHVAQKANKERTRENWLYNKAEERPNAPLVVIDFDGTEQSATGFPVRMARAKFDQNTATTFSGSTLIKPDKSWDIADDWFTDRGAKIGVSRDKLLTARPPIEVIEMMAEYTEGIPMVYCYDARLCSKFLDQIFEAAGERLDFKLRDISEYLLHDIDKRMALRAKLEVTQQFPHAKVRAECLRNALVNSSRDSDGWDFDDPMQGHALS